MCYSGSTKESAYRSIPFLYGRFKLEFPSGLASCRSSCAHSGKVNVMCVNPYKRNAAMPGYTGNIDLSKRPVVENDDGSISTVRSMSFNEDGKEILIPTISQDGKNMTEREAIDYYHKTGQHLGKFNTVEEANKFAQALHEQQQHMYVKRK